jgi:hypothetical protein
VSAEDYHDVPGFGGGGFSSFKPKAYTCNFCQQPIVFNQRKPFNKDGTPHRCRSGQQPQEAKETPQQATLFAMAAMNAIINASIQVGGVDFIHSMNFYDVADASWRAAAAMVSREKAYSDEFGGAS